MKQTGIYFLLLPIILMACTEPFNMNTNDAEPRIVIYGVVTGYMDMQKIYISSTAPYFSQEPNPPVSDAIVSVFLPNRVMQYKEYPDASGCYWPNESWCAEEGEIYTLRVEVDFDGDGITEIYEATTEVPHTIQLDSVDVAPITIMGHENYAVNIYGQDSPETEYYLFNFHLNGEQLVPKLTSSILTDDIMFNGEYINGMTIRYFDSILEYETDSEEDRARSTYIQPGDRIDVLTSVIPKGYYDFIMQCMNEKEGENPLFGGPPSNVTSNISNGALGYFTAYTHSWQEASVK